MFPSLLICLAFNFNHIMTCISRQILNLVLGCVHYKGDFIIPGFLMLWLCSTRFTFIAYDLHTYKIWDRLVDQMKTMTFCSIYLDAIQKPFTFKIFKSNKSWSTSVLFNIQSLKNSSLSALVWPLKVICPQTFFYNNIIIVFKIQPFCFNSK